MKMKRLFRFSLFLAGFLLFYTAAAQTDNPVKWKVSANKISDCEYEIRFAGNIEAGWHVYSLTLKGDDGPMPAKITVEKSGEYETIGKATEGNPLKAFDKVFEMNVAYFEKTVRFKQKIKLKTDKETVIKGTYEYQACTEEKCIFPPASTFEIKLQGSASCLANSSLNAIITNTEQPCECDSNKIYDVFKSKDAALLKTNPIRLDTNKKSASVVNPDKNIVNENSSDESDPWWKIFLTGLIWGFAALLTPCVFPMIPMNVSFFLKRSKTKAIGRFNATVYAASIIIIFVSLGLGISLVFGAGALNTLSTSAIFNLIIFVLLLVFAASFLGAFEIVLPSSFVNKIDKQSDRGGLSGIFFMALALVVVSFSCTGPMIGNALVAAAGSGKMSGPFWAMLGFSTGLAIPFGFFAFFPAMLNSIPKSGGWLNAVKVSLGFVEAALALKFASNVDLVYQWGILTREVFITLWIAIFGLLSIYLMGGFKTAHDSDTKHLSVTRLFFVFISLSLTIYLIPGIWGAPLKIFSGVLPPLEYSESPHGFGGGGNVATASASSSIDAEFAAYIEVNKNGIIHFKNDYEHALSYAKKTGKPLMIDFTGHACANCRKTEDYIWSDPEVLKRLNKDVVLVSLYVDDKRALDPKDYLKVFWYGKEREIKDIGDKFKYMEETLYKQSTQPLYVLIDMNEKILNIPRGYKSGSDDYVKWLDEGIMEFKKR